MSYELAIINPRSAPKRRRRATAKQLAWRRRFVAKYGKTRKVKRNPRTRRKSKPIYSGVSAMAKRRRRRSRARNAKGHFVKGHKRARRNPRRRKATARRSRRRAVGYTVGPRKIRRRKLNPRSRRRARRNPRGFGSLSPRNLLGQLVPAAYGAGGAIALNLALSYLPLPAMLQTGIPKQVTRLVGAMAVGWAAQKFLGGERAKAIGMGALTVVVYDIVKGLILTASPDIGARLGDFEDVSLEDGGFVDPASPIRGFGAYLENAPDTDGMGAYLQGELDGNLDGNYAYV